MELSRTGDWVWLGNLNQPGKVIDTLNLWGSVSYRLWLAQSNSVIKVDADQVSNYSFSNAVSSATIAYLASAARVAASQQEALLLAPMGSNVIPLPHQLKALNKAISKPQVRYLLADEVGLGKTIEAGLIMRELKLRGLARRTLVVAPKGLAHSGSVKCRFISMNSLNCYYPVSMAKHWTISGSVMTR
jgi:hypothetical protein